MDVEAGSAGTAPLRVECDVHGNGIAAVVCCHMIGRNRAPAGFVENSDDPDDLQAWCHACEAMFEQEDGMTDAFRAFNDMALVCVECYEQARAHHGLPAN